MLQLNPKEEDCGDYRRAIRTINKKIDYNVRPFILGVSSNDASISGPSLDDEVEPSDEYFINTFIHSQFCKDLMVLTWDKFMEEYGVGIKSLVPKCKSFFQKQCISLSWAKVPDTYAFI